MYYIENECDKEIIEQSATNAGMNYELAWKALKEILKFREEYLEERVKTDKRRNDDLTKGEIIGIQIVRQFMANVDVDK